MYPNLIQAPSEEELFIAHIGNPKLASQLWQLGISEDTEVIKQNRQMALKPVLIRANAGSLILSEAMATEMIIQRSNSRLASLALLRNSESGTFKGCIDGRNLAQFLGHLNLRTGDAISFERHLPSVELIPTLNIDKTVRLTLDQAARVTGTVSDWWGQFAAVQLKQEFKVEAIEGKTAAELRIKPGDLLYLKALEKATARSTIFTNAVALRIEDHSEFLFTEQTAAYIFVRTCDICWSCGECRVDNPE
jgi:hypothetical protein